MRLKLAVVGLIVITGAGLVLVPRPSYGVQDIGDWGNVTPETIGIVSTAWVKNPVQGIRTDAVDLDYTIAMNGITVAHGRKDRIRLPEGNTTLRIRTMLQRGPLPRWWASHIQAGEATTMQATVTGSITLFGRSIELPAVPYSRQIETDLIAVLDDALNRTTGTYRFSGAIVSPEIRITGSRAAWGPVNSRTTALDIYLTVQNPNPYPLPVPGFAGSLGLAGTTVAHWDSSTTTVLRQPADGVIGPGATEELGFRVRINNSRVIDWLGTHIRQGEQSHGQLRWRFAFEVQGARFTLPAQDRITCPFTITTAILVDGQVSNVTRQECRYGGGISGSGEGGSISGGSGPLSAEDDDGALDTGGSTTSPDDGPRNTTDDSNSTGDGGMLDPLL